jgi:hypothetical protein
MRILLAVAAGLVMLPLAAGARSSPSALTMKVTSHKVLYGHTIMLSGRLWGQSHANRSVEIDARPYGTSAPHRVAAVRTDATGRWTYTVSPKIMTRYQARAGATTGPGITLGVAPAISVATAASGRLQVMVQAARHFRRRFVELQSRGSRGAWTTIERKPLNRVGAALFTPPQRNAVLRFAMSINQAGAGYLGAASHALVYRPQSVKLAPSTLSVLYKHRVTFSGQVTNGQAGERVTITAHRYGHSDAPFTTVTTKSGGLFTFTARPGMLTAFRAHLRTGQMSPKVLVDVRPIITVRELGNGRVQTHVMAGKSLGGRMVQLQQLNGSRWQTIIKQPLRSNETATFSLTLSSSLLRVAMSVNQAGAGLLGSTSHSLFYRSV